MARYKCSVCDRTFKDEDRNDLVEKVQKHADRQHDTEISESDVQKDIEN